jgi:hypothetical protein
MTQPNQLPNEESLSPEKFLAEFEETPECFILVGGTMGLKGQTYDVVVTDCHASINMLLDDDNLQEHYRSAQAAKTLRLPLEIADDFSYVDYAGTSFRIGKVAYLHAAERKVPVRIVTLDDTSIFWLYREPQDIE